MIPLYSSSQVREADSYAINTLKIPSIALMENASRSIYEFTLEKFPELTTDYQIGVLCGKGNNGGDGFALARHFINAGFKVNIVALSTGQDLTNDNKTNCEILKKLIKQKPGSSITVYKSPTDLKKLNSCYIIFDALLGTGGKGELREPYKTIVKKVNRLSAYRIAVDVPTGLDVENSSGEIIFDAYMTVTLAGLKSGLFYGNGYVYSGEVEKGYIGIGDEYFDSLTVNEYLVEPEDAFVGLPLKKLDDYKYSAGKVLTIAGSGKLPGAACYTANSAIYGGAGASFLAFPESVKSVAQEKLESSIVESYDDEGKEYLSQTNVNELKKLINWADSIALGPGLGREKETINAVREIIALAKGKRLVIDADALYAISDDYFKKLNLKGMILTPHQQEFARLINVELKQLQNDLINYGKKFSKETKAYLILKGAPTITFTPSGDALINTTGNPGMATFGSGDVLTGVIAAFIAKSENVEDAVISAVYAHSLSADLLLEDINEAGVMADSIMKNIPRTVKFIEDSIVKSSF